MSLQIKRAKDNRVIKAILHRIADIPGGVTVCTADLGGSVLYEGTPIALGSDGLYHVEKTAKVVTEAAADAVNYEVAKGHHFKVSDYFATEGANGKQITAIDKTTNTDKDVITLAATLGVLTAAGTTAFQSTGANKTVKYAANSIVGSHMDVEANNNLFVDAWLIAVVKKGNAPSINDTVATTLKGIHYIV
jgi:hypothetical protein